MRFDGRSLHEWAYGNNNMTWLIAYDVSNDRRRAKIARLLVAKGIRLQKSVFLVEGPPRNVRRLTRELAANIDEATDTVCAWPLSESWKRDQLCFPESAAPLQEAFVIG